jgi:hypothetical protein
MSEHSGTVSVPVAKWIWHDCPHFIAVQKCLNLQRFCRLEGSQRQSGAFSQTMARAFILIIAFLCLSGCNAQQSTLSVFGADARHIRQIAIMLTIGAAVILAITAMF